MEVGDEEALFAPPTTLQVRPVYLQSGHRMVKLDGPIVAVMLVLKRLVRRWGSWTWKIVPVTFEK